MRADVIAHAYLAYHAGRITLAELLATMASMTTRSR